jgi:hypothetical protein
MIFVIGPFRPALLQAALQGLARILAGPRLIIYELHHHVLLRATCRNNRCGTLESARRA